jgi:Zn-finger nucleic acid-binding protein
MCCPKSGHSIEEIDFVGIKVDRCTTCSGLYFDKGEFKIRVEREEQKGFLSTPKQISR